MLNVVNQNQTESYRIRYFYLKEDNEHIWHMIGFDDETNELVNLAIYNFYKQAIETFARMDYEDNDIMYYKQTKKIFYMPENITDERECIAVYGSIY